MQELCYCVLESPWLGRLSVEHGALVRKAPEGPSASALLARQMLYDAGAQSEPAEEFRPCWMAWAPGSEPDESLPSKRQHRSAFFVVWVGRVTGVFTTWDECMRSVANVAGAKFKGFDSLEQAEQAFSLQR